MIQKYTTIQKYEEKEINVKKSRFICSIKPVKSEEEAAHFIQQIKKENYNANHNCSAFIIGLQQPLERCNDDGEPAGTAGKPMLEVLRGSDLTNVVAVVTRYFGGTLLGTGGLIKAYTESVKACLESAKIVEKQLCEKVVITLQYDIHAKVEYMLRNKQQIISDINYTDQVALTVFLDEQFSKTIQKEIVELTNDQCIIHSEGYYYVPKNTKQNE